MDAVYKCMRAVHRQTQLINQNLSNVNLPNITAEIESLLLSLGRLSFIVDSIEIATANPVTTHQALQCILSYLDSFYERSASYASSYGEEEEAEVRIMNSKVQVFTEFIVYAVKIPTSDLFSIPRTDERWGRLLNVVSYYRPPNPIALKQKYDSLIIRVMAGQAAICKSYEEPNKLKRTLMSGLYAMYYSTFTGKALLKTKEFHANPQLEIAQCLWNILEHSIVKNFMNIVLERIKVNKLIYVPRTVAHVLEPLQSLKMDSLLSRQPLDNYVQVRVLSKRKLSKLSKKNLPRTDNYSSILLHIHGGGFVAMSSASHQCYTRKWVNGLDIPCLSIDYRKSPTHPFPDALDDAWQVYTWVLTQAESQLGIIPVRIYLAGDSAGANIALGLTYKAIDAGIQLPTALFLSYPALNLSREQYTKSLLISLEDGLLPYTFLKLCGESYLPDVNVQPYHYASPIHAPQDVLEKLPPTRILVGDKDPLHDDCWRFTERLAALGKDVALKVFQGVIHGALNMCYKGGVKESNLLVDQIADWIREIHQLLGESID